MLDTVQAISFIYQFQGRQLLTYFRFTYVAKLAYDPSQPHPYINQL